MFSSVLKESFNPAPKDGEEMPDTWAERFWPSIRNYGNLNDGIKNV
jgi:hypothetical protein